MKFLNRRYRKVEQSVRDALPEGAEIVECIEGRKHLKWVIGFAGRERYFVTGKTPSCSRAAKNLQAGLRRLIREMSDE